MYITANALPKNKKRTISQFIDSFSEHPAIGLWWFTWWSISQWEYFIFILYYSGWWINKGINNVLFENCQVLLLCQKLQTVKMFLFSSYSSVVLHMCSLCMCLCCDGAVLCVLYPAGWLCWTQSIHQPELYLLHHSVCGLDSTKSTGSSLCSVS